jgi:hypothetical protein
MKIANCHVAGLSAVAAAALFFLGFDASAQDTKKAAPKAASACKGLEEKACRGKSTECLWIVPSKGKQKAYCRLRGASKKKA